MEEFIRFFKENPVCFLATAENGMPRVRPVQLMFEDDGKLYFCTANTKDVFRQLKTVPFVQLATTSKDYVTTLRVTGEVKFCGDRSVKESIMKESALVRSIYKTPDNPVFEAFYIEHGTARFQYLNGQPPKVIDF
jgi:uncharacterized pyridoxamine 5'-phosphate oxidase family protein